MSAASWLALPCLASISSNEAGCGVNGFGSFCRNKRASAAGPNPGNTHYLIFIELGAVGGVGGVGSVVSTLLVEGRGD